MYSQIERNLYKQSIIMDSKGQKMGDGLENSKRPSQVWNTDPNASVGGLSWNITVEIAIEWSPCSVVHVNGWRLDLDKMVVIRLSFKQVRVDPVLSHGSGEKFLNFRIQNQYFDICSLSNMLFNIYIELDSLTDKKLKLFWILIEN